MYRLALVVHFAASFSLMVQGCSSHEDAPTEPEAKKVETHKGIALVPIEVDAEPLQPKAPSPCLAEDQGTGAADLKRGKAHSVAGDMEEARAAFTRAIALDPKNPLAHFELGKINSSLGKAKDAANEFRLATELVKPCDDYAWIPEAYRLLGFALRESGGSIADQRDAFQKYIDRVEVNDDKSKEVIKLLIPMRRSD